MALNVILPGGEFLFQGRAGTALAILVPFFLGLFAAVLRHDLALSPRPGAGSLFVGTVLWALLALAAWVAGQLTARKG